jgi:SAM-dependent methyltransferase
MTEYGERYARYQLDRSWLRKFVRKAYLNSAASRLSGPTVDLGCGVGELLERLPVGSMGLDVNPVSVEHCRLRGLHAEVYDGEGDSWSLGVLDPAQGFASLVISHVLEHLDEPMPKLSQLLSACGRLGITRVLVIVPGRRGYSSDNTHRTFIDASMLSDPSITSGTRFTLRNIRHFPIDLRLVGNVFTHLELQAFFEQPAAGAR